MSDIKSPEVRSKNMAAIKSKDTKPEEYVRKKLFADGFRYRKNDKRYPGKPDIVLPKYNTIVFVHGCFWHQHVGCKESHIPKSRSDYWASKLKRNVERDIVQQELLQKSGWHVIVVWECELSTKEKRDSRINLLEEEIMKQRINCVTQTIGYELNSLQEHSCN